MATKYVMVCMGAAGTVMHGPAPVGQYLKSYIPEGNGGLGAAEWTHDLNEAKHFDSAKDVMHEWRLVPRNRPLRDDYFPNRPLTAYHMEIAAVDVP